MHDSKLQVTSSKWEGEKDAETSSAWQKKEVTEKIIGGASLHSTICNKGREGSTTNSRIYNELH